MYAIRHSRLALALGLVLVSAAHVWADCTQLPQYLGAITGTPYDNTADLDLYANYVSSCAAIDMSATGRIRLHERLLFGDTWTLPSASLAAFIQISPTITATGAIPLQGMRFAGTQTQTTADGATSGYTGINVLESISSSATIRPAAVSGWSDLGVTTCDGVACGTDFGTVVSFDESRVLQSLGAGGSMTAAALTTVRSRPLLVTDNAAGALTLTARRMLDCGNVTASGAGTITLTDNVCLDLADQTVGTNAYGIRSAITSGANKYFLKDDGGAQSKLTGKFTTYNATTTAGYGLATVVAAGRFTGQTAAKASVAAFTVGGSDGTFRISANVLVTTSTVHSFTVTCAYTDEGNTARTITLNFSTLAGVISNAGIANAGGAVPYEGVPLHIRAKSGTAITIATTGTFTTVTYNVEGLIEQLA